MSEVLDRARRAKNILEDPMIKEAFEDLESIITETWRASSDQGSREELWYTIEGLRKFKTYFEIAIENGDVEKHIKKDHKSRGTFSLN